MNWKLTLAATLVAASAMSFAQTRTVNKDGGELSRAFVYDASLATPLSGDAIDQSSSNGGNLLLTLEAPTTVNVLHYLAVGGLLGMNFKVAGFGTGTSAAEDQILNFATSSRISIEWLQFAWTGSGPNSNVDGLALNATLRSYNSLDGAGTLVESRAFNVGGTSGNNNQSTTVTYAPDLDDTLDGRGSVKLTREITVTPKQLGGTSYSSQGWLRFRFN